MTLVDAAERLRAAIAHIAAVHPLIKSELPDRRAERCLDDLADDLDKASDKLRRALDALEDVE